MLFHNYYSCYVYSPYLWRLMFLLLRWEYKSCIKQLSRNNGYRRSLFLSTDITWILLMKKIICSKIIWISAAEKPSLLGQPKSLLGQAPFSTFNYKLSFRKSQCAHRCLFLLDPTSCVSVLWEGWCPSTRLLLSASHAATLLGCERLKDV